MPLPDLSLLLPAPTAWPKASRKVTLVEVAAWARQTRVVREATVVSTACWMATAWSCASPKSSKTFCTGLATRRRRALMRITVVLMMEIKIEGQTIKIKIKRQTR